MVQCENCKKSVIRRVTFTRDGESKRVCKECDVLLGTQSYLALCDCIMSQRKESKAIANDKELCSIPGEEGLFELREAKL